MILIFLFFGFLWVLISDLKAMSQKFQFINDNESCISFLHESSVKKKKQICLVQSRINPSESRKLTHYHTIHCDRTKDLDAFATRTANFPYAKFFSAIFCHYLYKRGFPFGWEKTPNLLMRMKNMSRIIDIGG